MAHLNRKHPNNVDGDFYVDTSCIDCDACRLIAPDIYKRDGDQSIVFHQPINQTEQMKSIQALISCPTASIGITHKDIDINPVKKSFPIQIKENVYYCGYHSKKSYGAASYFIQRKEGNILIDSPRYSSDLADQFRKLGGIKYLYLTHRDDVADHDKYQQRFNCKRILHSSDICHSTKNIEIQIDGNTPYHLNQDTVIIPVPGHTKGHTVLLYMNNFLFTGDHLSYSIRLDHLYGFRNYCWYSWSEQIKSMESLLNYPFESILPGHGCSYHAPKERMRNELLKCIDWMYKSR